MKYQYYVHVWTDAPNNTVTDQQIQADLNYFGGQGWRLVNIERQIWDGSRRVTAYMEKMY